MQDFLHMGGYALYVWPSYGLTALVMLLTWWAARRRRASALRIAKARLASSEKARQARAERRAAETGT
ncbi:MAG: heme exporter protein CcmD [Pseudomonadota bacterium]